jgi:hypothetical protein
MSKNKGIQNAIKPSSKGKLQKATLSKNPTLKKEAVLAKTLKGFR